MSTCPSCGGASPPGMRFCGHCGASLAGDAPQTASREAALRSFVSDKVVDRLFDGHGLEGERRLVTALFADLSGFTALADRLDPEELLEVIDPIISSLTKVVGRYDGYVDKFAGDALLAFFGAPVAHDDDAVRALLVAQEMHETLKEMLADLPFGTADLTLHIGINTGHVISRVIGCEVRRDYSVLGDAVILAQRLESAAGPGETFVGAATYGLTKEEFDYESVGSLELKGKSKPVPAWKPISGRRARTPATEMVGREEELLTIGKLLLRARAGSGQVVGVRGGPGAGKSTLVAAIRRKAAEGGLRTVTVRSLPYGTAIPYWPFAELIRSLAGVEPDASSDETEVRVEDLLRVTGTSERAPVLRTMLGLAGPVPGLSPVGYGKVLRRQICEVVAALASSQPLLLVFEDAHWLDSASVEALADLCRIAEPNRLVLLVTSREEIRLEGATTIALGPLGRSAIASLARSLLGVEPSARAVDLLVDRSGGNPLFAEELVRVLRDKELGREQLRTMRAEAILADDDLPLTLEGVLGARIDALPAKLTRTLQVASVIGRRIRLPLLDALLGVEAHEHLQELHERGFLDRPSLEESEVTFHHVLVQEAAYERLLKRDRARLHLEVAHHAERLYGASDDVVGLLARHLYIGGAGERALPYLVRAGERAQSLFANDAAILHLERALEVTPEEQSQQRRSLLLRLGELYGVTGDFERSLERFRMTKEGPDDRVALLGEVAALRNLSRYREAMDLIAGGLNADDPETAPLWLESGWILAKEGSLPEAREAFRSALRLATDDELKARVNLRLSRMATAAGDLAEAVDLARAAVAAYEGASDSMGLASALRALGIALMHAGDPESAAASLRRALELAERTGNIEEVGGCLINLGLVELKRGNLDEAIASDMRALEEFERMGHRTGKAIAHGNLAEKLLDAGRLPEATEASLAALRTARSIGDRETVADVFRTLARIRTRDGNGAGGLRAALQSAALYEEMQAPAEVALSMEAAREAALAAGRTNVVAWLDREMAIDIREGSRAPSASAR